MNEWMETFISQCLTDVPPGKYRARTEKELRDHMQTQLRFLSEAEALQVMGDPERLRKEYYIAWKQTPMYRASWIVISVVAVWGMIILSTCLTALFPFSESLLSNGLAFGIVLFLIPFSLGAFFLRTCFREERRRTCWVTLGLLLSWATFHSWFIRLMIAFEEFDQYYEQTVWLAMLLNRFPWLTLYLWSSFVGCLALGWLFGRKKKGSLA